ncbi:hypothetical protein GPALN_003480 [Globodera pallida]|nr:hypothetical protein GPALN_003480 [Globodera pallida]
MAVLTPAAFATQNAADLITNSTAQIIRMEMDEALTKIIALRMDTLDWALLLSNPTPFVDKFETFILINCMAEQSIGADEFCQFVDGRIRWQLFVDIDQSNGATAHLWPDLYSQNCEELSNKFISASFRTNYCKVWLVGLKCPATVGALGQFDLTIKRHYLIYNNSAGEANNGANFNGENNSSIFHFKKSNEIDAKFQKLKIELKSIIVSREELADFEGKRKSQKIQLTI